MNELLITCIFIGSLTVTSYRSVPAQTDSSPWLTSIGERVTIRGCAVSQDFLHSGELKYGDMLYVQGYGYRVINDCMHPRYKRSVDLWVLTEKDEKKIGIRKAKVWLVRSPVVVKHEKKN